MQQGTLGQRWPRREALVSPWQSSLPSVPTGKQEARMVRRHASAGIFDASNKPCNGVIFFATPEAVREMNRTDWTLRKTAVREPFSGNWLSRIVRCYSPMSRTSRYLFDFTRISRGFQHPTEAPKLLALFARDHFQTFEFDEIATQANLLAKFACGNR